MNRKFDIAFISAFHAPFIQEDIDFLKKHFEVRVRIGRGFFSFLKIFWLVLRSDIVFCWFASVYASVAVMIGRCVGVKSFIVIGGVDVAKDDEIGYGIWRKPWKARMVRYALRKADRVLAVDPSLKADAIRLAEYDGQNIIYTPTGYDCEFWKPAGVKVPLGLCVAVAADSVRVKIKGLDLFVKAAESLPDIKFILVGISSTVASSLHVPSNMMVHPVMERTRLLPFYQHAKVYCLPSRREGLSNALCEAMLCGCIPVATDVGGNRTAVGDTGILVPANEVSLLTDAIQRACMMEESAALKARARIVSLFPREKRNRDLLRVIQESIS
jgi:glycosyltransferase involved in cell wall biosynthesis